MHKRKPNAPELDTELDLHEKWIASGFHEGRRADFSNRDLQGSDFSNRNLSGARFRYASLRGSTLIDTIFHGANLYKADFTGARMFDTVFRRVDLSSVLGLDTVLHHGPSTIGIDTILRSRGRINRKFLIESGTPSDAADELIAWATRHKHARAFQSVFISYGGPDESFARSLKRKLQANGVDTFLFSADASPGDRLHRVMREGVNEYDKVVLVCSESSLNRLGVQNEIEEALSREAREGGSQILIPIRIDDFVLSDWAPKYPGMAAAIRDRVIANFAPTSDQNDAIPDDQFEKLISVLVDEA